MACGLQNLRTNRLSDPVLTYVRGKGWVYEPDNYFCEAVTNDGVKCRVYKRKPTPGAYWIGRYERDTVEVIQGYLKTCNSETIKVTAWKEDYRRTETWVLEFDD